MTRIPFPPEPAIAGDGSVLVVEQSVWLIAVPADGTAVETVELGFEPGSVAVSPLGGFVAAGGEGRLAIVDRDVDRSSAAERDVPITEPSRLTVTDAGTAMAAGEGLVIRVAPDAEVATGEISEDLDGLVAVSDSVAFVWGSGRCRTVTFDGVAATVTDVEMDAPDDALRVGDRLGLRRGGALVLADVDELGALEMGEEIEIGDVERLVASPSGRFVLTAAVSWDGAADHLLLERIDLDSGDRESIDPGDAGPDEALVIADDGTPTVVHGLIRPMRVVARRLDGSAAAPVEVDLDAVVDDLA